MNLIIFYFFAAILILSSLMVISARNPVHSLLFLILGFFTAAGLFILQGAEFLGLLMILIYVGAVAILLLFVIMMLDIDRASLAKNFRKNLPIGILISLVLFAEIYMAITLSSQNVVLQNVRYPIDLDVSNIDAIGAVLYTDFFFHFQLAGIVLLVAMMGAVLLAHRGKDRRRSQNIKQQVSRKRADSVKLVKVLSGKGV